MAKKFIYKVFILVFLIACQCNQISNSQARDSASQLYSAAGKMVKEFQYDSAMVLLRQAYEKGIENPMQIVTDSNFYNLIDHPEYRPEIRLLLEKFAVENQTKMVRVSENGEPIIVNGLILDASNNKPLEAVQIELVQADRNGLYFKENSMWNPRLFAYLTTNGKGEFSIRTIRPGRYKDDDGNLVPAHIHFSLKKDGYRIFGSEFAFEDDSILVANGNIDGLLIAKLKAGAENEYQIHIPMQRE